MTESKCGSASRILQKNATQLACSMLSLTQKKKNTYSASSLRYIFMVKLHVGVAASQRELCLSIICL